MTSEIIDVGQVQVIEVGIPGAQGAVGLLEIDDDGNTVVVPVGRIDFYGAGFAVTQQSGATARVELDLSDVAAGGELGGTLDAPTVDATHSGSTHQSITDAVNAHQIDVVDAHDAAAVSFVPTGTITSADAQSAIVEALTDGKAYTDDGHVILTSQRGAVSGVASLDSSGKVPVAQVPAIAFGNTFVVASQAAMLALTANPGDIAVRSDISETFILTALPASTLGNWVELLSGAGGVTSVNGLTGAVSGIEQTADKNAAGGYPSLDGSGYVPDAQINPTIARGTAVTSAISTTEAYADTRDAAHAAASDPHPTYETAAEAQALVDVHTADVSAAHGASAVSFTPTGTIDSTDVQAAIAEVASEAVSGGSLPFASPTISLSTVAATGSATSVIHSDATIVAFDTTTPTASAVADSAATGIASRAARRDHAHGREGFGSPSTQAFADAAATGSAATIPHSDHKHAMPADPVPSHVAAGDPHAQYELETHAAAVLGVTFNVMDYAAIGDGSADDTAAINSTSAAANAATNGVLVLPPGKTFKTTAGLNAWKCHVRAGGATINFTPADNTTGTAVTIGDGTSTVVQWKRIDLPNIVKTSKYWSPTLTGTDTGLKMWATIDCKIYMGRIKDFTIGAYALGGTSAVPSSPFSFSDVFVGHLDNDKVSLKIDDGGTSYCNEINWYGGHYSHDSNSGDSVTGAKCVLGVITGSNPINMHRFYGACWEGDVAEFQVDTQGSHFTFNECRWESTHARVKYNGANATSNVVFYGYNAENITYTDTGSGNKAYTKTNLSLQGSGSTAGILRVVNQSSGAYPSILVADAGKNPLVNNMATDWKTSMSAVGVAVKALAQSDFAIRMHILGTSGTLEFGDGAGNITAAIYQYAGTPEGNLAANKGSYCADTTNGEGYIKTTNTVNTGWKLVTHA